MKTVYLQGNLVSANKAKLALSDRAFKFSDGIFETIRVENGKAYNLAFHQKRMNDGLKALGIKVDSKLDSITKNLIQKNKLKNGFVRISISSCGESLGYSAKSSDSIVYAEAMNGLKPAAKNAKLHISKITAQRLVNAKTKNALHYILAMNEAKKNGADSSLLLDQDGYICETANGNIFWFKGGTLFTPSIDLPLISGSIQSRIFKLYKGKIRQGKFKLPALKQADEVFMTNVSCLIQPFGKAKKSLELKKLIEDDIRKNSR